MSVAPSCALPAALRDPSRRAGSPRAARCSMISRFMAAAARSSSRRSVSASCTTTPPPIPSGAGDFAAKRLALLHRVKRRMFDRLGLQTEPAEIGKQLCGCHARHFEAPIDVHEAILAEESRNKSRYPCCNDAPRSDISPGRSTIGRASGCSSGVEHNLAKVGVEGSNPFARSRDWRPSETGDRRCDISSQNFLANVPSLHRCRRSDIARAMFCAFCTRSFAKRRSPQRKKPPPERGPYLVPSRLVNSQTAFSELLGSR